MDGERHEDVEPQVRVRMVGSVGDEALGELVEDDRYGGLEGEGEEGVLRDVVVVGRRVLVLGACVCCAGEGGGPGGCWRGWAGCCGSL